MRTGTREGKRQPLASDRSRRKGTGWALAAVLLCACAGAQPAPPISSSAAAATAAPKRATLAMLGDPPTFSYLVAGPVPGVDGLQDLVHVGLAAMSPEGLLPMLAEGIPAVENGQWEVFPDGQMQTTWTLRPNLRWHDGAPVTADDFVFTIQVARDLPEFKRNTAVGLLNGAEARDERTLVAHWKEPFISADWLFTSGSGQVTGLMPLPKHLLEVPYNENKGGFLGLPYWNQEFVGTGPFKVREFAPSSYALLRANDQYMLGRPRIDEIEVKFILDSNAIVLNLLSGVVDMTLGRTISNEQALNVASQGTARAEATPFNLQRIFGQFNNPRPAVIGDARLRQALLYGVNRQEMIEGIEAGLTAVPTSIFPPHETRYHEAEAGASRYPYDPQQALRQIESMGYVRGPGDALVTAAGDKLGSIELRGIMGDDNQSKMLLAVVGYWQRLGVPVDLVVVSRQQYLTGGDTSNRPGFSLTGGPNGLSALATMISSQVPRPANNYVGGNYAQYASPEYDALYRRYVTTISQSERAHALSELLEHLMTTLPFMPLYYRVEARVLANRLTNVTPRTLEASLAWDAYQWEVH